MSESDIDAILKKYDKNVQRVKPAYLHTEKKKERSQPHYVTFMDNNYTPIKQSRTGQQPHGQQKYPIEDILKQLDQNQRKLIISEKNYAEMCRKYDKLKQGYDLVSNELENQRKIRLQQLIDTQNKLHLLQTDNEKNLTKLQSRQHTILLLKEKLSQKEEQIVIFQQQLEQISQKLSTTFDLKNKQSFDSHEKYLSVDNLQTLKLKYEKNSQAIIQEIEKFKKDLIEKQKQKKKLLGDIQQLSKKHLQEIRELKQVIAFNEKQYKEWLDQSKKQKIETIQKYEHELRVIRKSEFLGKLGKADDQIEGKNKNKQMIKQMEEKNLHLQREIVKIKGEIERLETGQKQYKLKLMTLHEQLKHVKVEYGNQLSENKSFLHKLKMEEQKCQKLKIMNNKIQIQLQSSKIKCTQYQNKIQSLQKNIQFLKTDVGKQLGSLIQVKKELHQATNNQLNINSTLTQNSIKLERKIQALEEQLQTVTTQLYAERLQKAKLAQELEQTKVDLKREYQLSIENTKRELQDQIKQKMQIKTDREIENEKLYLKMFQIERQYQILKSEVVTSQQMLKMGTKMNKYYQKRIK